MCSEAQRLAGKVKRRLRASDAAGQRRPLDSQRVRCAAAMRALVKDADASRLAALSAAGVVDQLRQVHSPADVFSTAALHPRHESSL